MPLRLERNVAAAPRLAKEMVRAFRESDLAPVPPGWRAGPPDFVGIGSSKSGTTWWYWLLHQHPQVEPNLLGAKEPSYFCHFGWDGPNDAERALYRRAFAAPPGSISGDWSCDYLSSPLAIQHLADCAPEAKLVAMLRNPIDRCVSSLNMWLGNRAAWTGLAGERGHVFRTFSLFPEAVNACRVADGLRQVLRRQGRDRLLVLQYERCRVDPRGELRRTLRFLGVDEDWAPEAPERPVNVAPYRIPRPDAAARARLAAVFADDVAAQLELFPELDPALWSDFA